MFSKHLPTFGTKGDFQCTVLAMNRGGAVDSDERQSVNEAPHQGRQNMCFGGKSRPLVCVCVSVCLCVYRPQNVHKAYFQKSSQNIKVCSCTAKPPCLTERLCVCVLSLSLCV